MAKRKKKYAMDFIEDKELFKAVMFARKMMGQGTPPAVANTRAAEYYGYEAGEVAHYTGQVGGRKRAAK
jgi:hypothetical protein